MWFPATGGRRSARSAFIRFMPAAVAVPDQDLRNGPGSSRRHAP
jgi:hypothetical protein